MNVRELIEILSTQDPEAKVVVAHAPARHANAGELQAGGAAQRIFQILDRPQVQLITSNDRYAGGCIAQLPLGRGGGNNCGLEIQGFFSAEGRQRQ